jgi:hypothetical protein
LQFADVVNKVYARGEFSVVEYYTFMNVSSLQFSILFRFFVSSVLLAVVSSCTVPADVADAVTESSSLQVTAFRFRNDFNAELNEDTGWAAAENQSPALLFDEPFRLRIQVRANEAHAWGHIVGLQYRWSGAPWLPLGFSEFPYPSFATPAVSAISTQAYLHGEETDRLLGNADMDWEEGAGLNGVASTPVWNTKSEAMEWEWPLVIRRFSDGPTFVEDGSVIELRVVDGNGIPLPGPAPIKLELAASRGHLGGTFVETPGRLGPYQSADGHLYFFMEPSETDNRFMAVQSMDFGKSWREVDGPGRPNADDLEGVASVRVGSTIHLLHQVSREVFYHAFDMGGGAALPSWRVNSESIATPEEPPTQFADVTARSDGSLVAVYGGARKLFIQTRSPAGVWGEAAEIDTDIAPDLSGPLLVTSANDVVTLAYTGRDGSGFIRHFHPDGSLSSRQILSSNLGSDDKENGAILPLVALPESEITVVIYRERDGILYERRFSDTGVLSAPIKVSNLPVITDAVDSEQAGADVVRHGSSLHLIFIEQHSRSIFYSRSDRPGIWSEPKLLIEGIDGSWIRGSVHHNVEGHPVYGFVYDGGSRGGSGFNRYFALVL